MSEKDLNIKSSTIEKGLELVKDFLGKLIGPAIEEIGLLIADPIKFWRFKNQVKILEKAKKFIEKRNITMKEIPIKILVPLLEQASLEEDEELQEKWAKMIANMANSEKNFQNNIFPYILGQISIAEFNALKELYKKESALREKIAQQYEDAPNGGLIKKIDVMSILDEDEYLDQGFEIGLHKFECENLMRLLLIKNLLPEISISKNYNGWFNGTTNSFETTARFVRESPYKITQLGEKFLEVCELDEDK